MMKRLQLCRFCICQAFYSLYPYLNGDAPFSTKTSSPSLEQYKRLAIVAAGPVRWCGLKWSLRSDKTDNAYRNRCRVFTLSKTIGLDMSLEIEIGAFLVCHAL